MSERLCPPPPRDPLNNKLARFREDSVTALTQARFEVGAPGHSLEDAVDRQVDVLRRGVAVAGVLDRSIEFRLAPVPAQYSLPEEEPLASAVLVASETLEQL